MSRSRREEWGSNRFRGARLSKDAVEKVLAGRTYLAFITFVTIYSLIGDQIRVAVLPPSSDIVFKYFNTLVFFMFVLEVCLMAATTDKYKSMGIKPSFYFVMDVLSTLMLIFDPTYVSFVSIASESSGNNGAWRASKASRLSAKAVRIIRILRLTSFLRLVKFQVTTGAVRTPDTMGQEPESGDHQPFSFLKRPAGLARARSPSALILSATGGGEGGPMSPVPPPKHKESRLGAAVSESNHRKVIIGCLLLLSAAPLLNYSAIDNSWKFALGLCADVARRGDISLTRAVVNLVATAAGGVGRLEANGVVYYNDPKNLDHLRRNEIATYTYDGAQAKQSVKQASSQTAWENVGMVAVVLVLFLSLSLALQADLSRLVLQPLRQMMDLVECISNNPLAPIQESMLGSQEKQGLEPTMLLQTIGKIGSLVKIGLGEAGADIISRSLRDSHNFKLDLVNGKLVKGVFVFCDIRNFTDTTECLQEEVMVFVNKIACILHSVTTQCNGAPNKNVGDAFLLVWNIQERGDVDAAGSAGGGQAGVDNLPVFSPGGNRTLAQTGSQADKALYAVLKFTCEMIRRSSFVCQFSSTAAQRLYHRMPNYRVGIGFGLHMGWAVEGPIGSDQKIDVSYISPHVSMSEWLQDLTKEYGCGVLLSDQVYRLLSSPAQYVCRQIDCIRRSDINQNEEPFNIYTYDCDLDAMYKQVEIEQQGPEAPRTAARPIKRTSGNEMSLTPKMMSEWTGASGADAGGTKTTRYQGGADLLKVEVKPYNTLVWESDTDLQTLRSMAPPAFRTTWNFAMSSYLAGEWGSAKQGFETALEISQGRDKASQRLLSILAASGDKAPLGWPGYREHQRAVAGVTAAVARVYVSGAVAPHLRAEEGFLPSRCVYGMQATYHDDRRAFALIEVRGARRGMARSRVVLGVGRHGSCILGLLALACKDAHAILPLGQITYDGRQAYCAPAGFGPHLPSTSHAVNLALVEPIGITDGCEPKVAPQSGPFALFVSRGNCSFVNKALAAQAIGASAVVVHNSLEGTYVNQTIVEDKFDYECSNGNGWLSTVADPLWSPANDVPACTSSERCASGRCVVTNSTDAQKGREVCCAWDLYITMGGDPAIAQALNIPTVFVTMRDGDTLKDAMAKAGGALNVKIAERPRPSINVSSFLIWAMGVFIVIIAAWKSSLSSAGGPPKTREAQMRDRVEDEEEEPPAVDLSVAHTVGFICTASAFLILLFYVDLNAVISVLYCISAGSAVSTIIARPIIKRMMPRRNASAPLINIHRWDIYVSCLDALSTFAGLGLAVWWYLVRHKASYAWVLQDIMGASLCILFLSLVRFPNIKVATVLLCLAFFYDIFFVFLSPLIFQESVMIKVATGGAPKADPTYCEKYPSDRDCKTREELPMLLVLPRINDFQGGNTMLGLGDIILPGLLVAFAARYDRATNTPLSRGYFRIMCLGYAVGLMMANAAVYLMEMGQPALLYLVPCTLGVFVAVAYREGTLKSFWDGPAVLTGGNSGPGGSPKPPSPVAAVVVTGAPLSMASGGQPGLVGHRGAPDLVAGTAVGQSGPEEEPLLEL